MKQAKLIGGTQVSANITQMDEEEFIRLKNNIKNNGIPKLRLTYEGGYNKEFISNGDVYKTYSLQDLKNIKLEPEKIELFWDQNNDNSQ